MKLPEELQGTFVFVVIVDAASLLSVVDLLGAVDLQNAATVLGFAALLCAILCDAAVILFSCPFQRITIAAIALGSWVKAVDVALITQTWIAAGR